jgi:hypothetical protein
VDSKFTSSCRSKNVCANSCLLEKEKFGIHVITLMLYDNVQVVTREAIPYGLFDCSSKESLINMILPYAQRYIYKRHNDKYIQLKQSDFGILNNLKVIVVEKLFYKNVIKDCDNVSKERVECSCLLQVCWNSCIFHNAFKYLEYRLFHSLPVSNDYWA